MVNKVGHPYRKDPVVESVFHQQVNWKGTTGKTMDEPSLQQASNVVTGMASGCESVTMQSDERLKGLLTYFFSLKESRNHSACAASKGVVYHMYTGNQGMMEKSNVWN